MVQPKSLMSVLCKAVFIGNILYGFKERSINHDISAPRFDFH